MLELLAAGDMVRRRMEESLGVEATGKPERARRPGLFATRAVPVSALLRRLSLGRVGALRRRGCTEGVGR